jgi:hypothetical protein
MENRAKSIFYSVLFNKFLPRTNLMAGVWLDSTLRNPSKSDGTFGNYYRFQKPEKILRIWKFDMTRVPPIQISTKKG